MLQITPRQMEALSQAAYQDFEKRTIAHLARYFPEKINRLSDPEKSNLVIRCIKKAKTYELHSEQAVVCFSHLPLLLGQAFETDPRHEPIVDIITDQGNSPNDRAKLAMLLAYELSNHYT